MPNLAENLRTSSTSHPERPAVRLDDLTLSYSRLDTLTAQAAAYLANLGVGAGDRVGLMVPNVVSFPVLYYGILRLGAVVVPMNPLLKGREVQHYVTDSGMKVLLADLAADTREAVGVTIEPVSDHTLLPGLAAVPPRTTIAAAADDDTAVILYTSGTTGTPKGAELTHRNLDLNCRAANALAGVDSSDVLMGCLPLFHSFGQSAGMNAAVVAGALLTLVPRFDAATALSVIARDRVTRFQGVPTMYTALLAQGPGGHDLSSLRLCVSGGASLPGEVLRSFAEEFGAEILEGYGLSETSPMATFNRPGAAKVGSIGTPIPGVEIMLANDDGSPTAVGEVGEILIRGHNVMKGYWGRPEASAEAVRDGWFRSGDLARVDEDGFYFIVDRKKELIIRGGFNVYPREVEEVLYEHPDVLEAAVLGTPHSTHGEEVVAAVALRPGATTSPADIREFVRARVAPYKYPRAVWILDALPKGATGKILKRAIDLPPAAQPEGVGPDVPADLRVT
ncbi:long-chain-fatty-acid--CoA ligase [Marmoricola sp. RAF53]|uniref:long-chain-fatty-acid--CoA ligase n=1 Tax=Marmoricola sp. RAF53 TaxID=3233059 RepID=UPI003F9EAEDE